MKIEDRVFDAIEHAGNKRFDFALNSICPAIEATARKRLTKDNVSGLEYKQFVRSYYWLLERFMGGGLNLEDTRFPVNFATNVNGKAISEPDFADLVYHLFRCTFAHGKELFPEFSIQPMENTNRQRWGIGLDGSFLQMPEGVVWALIALVVFCSENGDIATTSRYWLSWGGDACRSTSEPYRFDIDVFWGAEKTIQLFLTKKPCIRVQLDLAKKSP